jgi:PAS domain S-box-containing protein
MGAKASRAEPRAGPRPKRRGTDYSPLAVLQFAISQVLGAASEQSGAAQATSAPVPDAGAGPDAEAGPAGGAGPDAGAGPAGGAVPDSLRQVLEQATVALHGRAALLVRVAAGGPAVLVAAHPPDVSDPVLLTEIGAWLAERGETAGPAGEVRERTLLGAPGPGEPAAPWRDGRTLSALSASARPPAGRNPYALIVIGDGRAWADEDRSTVQALATIIVYCQHMADDSKEIAERRAVSIALIEASPDAVVIADSARRIAGFNPAAEELYGRRRAEVMGQDMPSLLIPERDRARYMVGTEEFLRSGQPGEFSRRMHLPVLRSDGTERLVELTPLALVVRGEAFFCGFLRDITELERAHAALSASEAELRLLSELAPVGIARTDPAGTSSFVNERWCVLGKGQPAGFLGESWLRVVHPADTARVAQEWATARASGVELRVDCRLRPGGGHAIWVHAAVAPLPGDDGRPGGYLVALTNVSARKRAEEERARLLAAERAARRHLADQTQRLNSLIAVAIPGILVADEHDIVVQLNASLCDLLGIDEPPERLTGASIYELTGAVERTFADPAAVLEHMERHRQARQRVADARFSCADGRTVDVDYWPVRVGGEYRGDIWLLWDVSERVAREEERERALAAELAARRAAEQAQAQLAAQNDRLRELDDFKTQFLATVSHELRGPLSSISSYAALISDDTPELPDQAREFLGVIERNSDRVIQLVGDLLLLSQIEAGVIPLEPAPADVPAMVAEAVATAAPAAAQRGVALGSVSADGPPLRADRFRLLQVIDNLINNAIKFTEPGGQVRVTAVPTGKGPTGEGWRLDVTDSGTGIAPKDLDHLFERFYRSASVKTAGRPGSGLGLSIVKEIIELHGGRVEVSSELGEGTTFSVCLPSGGPGS